MTMFERNSKINSVAHAQSALERAVLGALDLQGAQLEFAGHRFISLQGHMNALNPQSGEVRGQVTILASARPSVLSGSVKLRAQGLEFELSMICVREAAPGELSVKFLGRYVPGLPRSTIHA